MIAWLMGLAWGQAGSIEPPAYEVEDCRPRVIPGTVGYDVGRQSIETNAQAYSAEALVSRSLSKGSPFAFQLNNVYGVTRVPAVALCGQGQLYGSVALDLFASATGLAIPIKLGDAYELKLFYAGSVTGSAIHYPDGTMANSRYYTSWAYAGFGYLAAFAAPLAPLLSRDEGMQTMVGDFIAGGSFGLPGNAELGTLDVGYVYSSGLYTNVSSRRLALFATTMLTDRFTLLALVRAGLEDLPVVKSMEDDVGTTSLYGRNMVLSSPTPAEETPGLRGLYSPKAGAIDFTTIHFSQKRIGRYVTVNAALSVVPRVFLHEGSVAVQIPATQDPDSPLVMDAFAATAGIVEMPALPWYGTDGGRTWFVDASFLNLVHVRRNAPATLSVFPYAQDAWEFSLIIDAKQLGLDQAVQKKEKGAR